MLFVFLSSIYIAASQLVEQLDWVDGWEELGLEM